AYRALAVLRRSRARRHALLRRRCSVTSLSPLPVLHGERVRVRASRLLRRLMLPLTPTLSPLKSGERETRAAPKPFPRTARRRCPDAASPRASPRSPRDAGRGG